MKMKGQRMKRWMAAILAVIMLSGIFVTTMPEEAEAAGTTLVTDRVIKARIQELKDILVGTYFNKTHKGTCCGSKWVSGHGETECCGNSTVIKQTWFKNAFKSKIENIGNLKTAQFPLTYTKSGYITRSAKSCAGFASFAEWYIFRTSDSATVNTKKIGSYANTKSNWTKNAKVGDLIRLEYGSGGGHSFIYLSNNDKGVWVLDCNWSNAAYNCKVQTHYISYSSSRTFTISRATIRANCKHTDGYKTEWNGDKYVATVCKKCGATFSYKIDTSVAGTLYTTSKVTARTQPYSDAPGKIDYSAYDKVTVLGKTENAYGNVWYQVKKGEDKGYILGNLLTSTNPNVTANYEVSYFYNSSGKNYIPDSDFTAIDSNNLFSRDTAVSTISIDTGNKHNGYNSLKVVNKEAGKNGHDIVMKTTTQGCSTKDWVGNDKAMTLSFWAKSSVSGTTFSVRWGYEPTSNYRKVTLTTSWKKYTIRVDKTKVCDNYLHWFLNAKGTFWMTEAQLEDGTSATAFVPEKGGTYATKKSTYPGKFSLPAAPTRSGYTFDGWYTKAVDGTKITSSTASKCGKYAVYAHWTKNSSQSDPDVYYTYSVSYIGEDGKSLGTSYIKNLANTTHTVTPQVFSGYETPAAQTVTWDVSVKTIIFTYKPVKTYTYTPVTKSGTIWSYNGKPALTYKVVIETRNRTASTIEFRVKWTNTIVKDRFYGYTQKFEATRVKTTTGELTICDSSKMGKSTVGTVRTATKTSAWVKATGLKETADYITVTCKFISGCSSDNLKFSQKVTIPEY